MKEGIVLRAGDGAIESEAKRHGYAVAISADLTHPFERALVVEPGTPVPWALVAVGLHLLEKWDAAAALVQGKDERHTLLARDIPADGSERLRTEKIVHDLRMPAYACELLFVRGGEIGTALIETWRDELCHGPNRRLAFLRAFYQVKPRLCALPRLWAGDRPRLHERKAPPEVPEHLKPYVKPSGEGLVRVEIRPGVYVRCKPGHEAEVMSRLGKLHRPRAERR